MSDDKPEEKDGETERKQSRLDEYRYRVDTGGAIVCSNDAYELLDALRDMRYL